MKELCILGSTGSIGTQTLEVVRNFPEELHVRALTCGSNIELLAEQIKEFSPELASVATEEKRKELLEMLPSDTTCEILFGEEGNLACATLLSVNCVVAAMVGMRGLPSVVAAIKAGKDIALANKETLVSGGSVVMPLIKEKGVALLPVDSEHSAIWQCLMGQPKGSLKRILLTASGGPFRGYSREQLEKVTLSEALAHPTWKMGGKITIDSASMMNKGLEIIEASWLFDIPVDDIEVVVHPQSIIHSMIELSDGSVLGQMGHPNMMMPIQVALFYPRRSECICKPFAPFSEASRQLTFEPCDREVFRLVDLAYQAGRTGGSLPVAMNAANEIVVSDFLSGRVPFLEIERTVEHVMEQHIKDGVIASPSLDEIFAVDTWARAQASIRIN
ncbi:MAG: 1-deoxy-D-xylulose-5-phosphate reductoisomerase [Clostridiales bacterium]|nr:1-deoxy-D-xylulose-5-phosphate reductoisomerase [Clostridiales bacterium]